MTVARRLLCALLILAAGCAPKTPPTTTITPRFPGFVFPEVPRELTAQPALAGRHQAAWDLLQAGDVRGAERDFTWVLERSPAYFPSETGLGYVALARKDYRAALQHFELGLAVAPLYAPGLVGRGEALLGLGRTAEAIACFEAALSTNPALSALRPRIDALRFRGLEEEITAARKARDAGRYEEAVQAYERAIAASPESGFLYRELAVAEQRLGRLDAAVEHARRALALDPLDARAHAVVGEVFESRGEFAAAIAEFEKAAALEPGPEMNARLDRARQQAALAALPAEYHAIPAEPAITRAQLAALIGVRLEDLLRAAGERQPLVMTDTRGSWAHPWIAAVVRTGVMDPFPNHTFQPAAGVRRGELATVISRLLGIAAARTPAQLDAWRTARPGFADLSPGHLSYPAAAMAVAANVLQPADDGSFQAGRPVSGAEAIQALDRVAALWQDAGGGAAPRR